MTKCLYCLNEASATGACEKCKADFDQAMDDLFDVLDELPVESKGRAFESVGHLFPTKRFDDIVESDDLRG
jgi:hypothetical protein